MQHEAAAGVDGTAAQHADLVEPARQADRVGLLDDFELHQQFGKLHFAGALVDDDAHRAVAAMRAHIDDGAREYAVAQRGRGDQHLAFVAVFDRGAGRSFHDRSCYARTPACQKEKRAAFQPFG